MAGPWEDYATTSGPWEDYSGLPKAKPKKIGKEGFADALGDVKQETFEKGGVVPLMYGGMGAFLDNAAMRLKQIVTGNLSDQEKTGVTQNRELLKDPIAGLGSLAPNVMMGAVSGPGLIGNVLTGAGMEFGTKPVLEGESATDNALRGGAGGALGWGAGKLVTGSPIVSPSDKTKRLLDEGIVPTLGQNAQSKGRFGEFLGGVEEKATSIPVIGDLIKNARKRGLEEFNSAAINRAVPKGETVKQIGREGIEEAIDKTAAGYAGVYAGSKTGPTVQLAQDIAAAKQAPAIGLSVEAERKFDTLMDRLVWQRLTPNTDAGLVKMTIESDLGKEARNLRMSGNSDDKALGQAIMKARDAIRDSLSRTVGAKSSKLPELNKAYASGMELNKAAERASASGGVFTPYQLQKASGPNGILRPLADDAQAVLASRIPNSGTTDRALQAMLFSGQTPDKSTLLGMLGSVITAPMYSRLGQRAMLGDLTSEQMQALSPYLSQGLRGVLTQ